MSSTTPSATRKSASLARLHRENGSPCPAGLDLAIFLISRRWASVNTGGRPPAYRGYNESNPSALKLCSTSRTRSSLVKASPAICATLMPCAGHSTICARRHVTTDPDPRRTIRFRRLPSPSLISRTRTRPAIPRSVTRSTSAGNPRRPAENRANVDGYGTSYERLIHRAGRGTVAPRWSLIRIGYTAGAGVHDVMVMGLHVKPHHRDQVRRTVRVRSRARARQVLSDRAVAPGALRDGTLRIG